MSTAVEHDLAAPCGEAGEGTSAARCPWGKLPQRVRALLIVGRQRTGRWLARALASDRASKIVLEEVVGASEGVARLREEVYDVVLLSHDAGGLDALELVEALRGGGAEEPIVVLGEASEQELGVLAYEVGADAYVCVHSATTRALIWCVGRVIEHQELVRETRRLQQADRNRLEAERREAERLLSQQHALLGDLERLKARSDEQPVEVGVAASREAATVSEPPWSALPAQLVGHYRELLRAYVIMGAGNLVEEMASLAQMLAAVGISADQAMSMHLGVLEELVAGLGSRSARHVMTRADLMVLEVMMHLAESYRHRDCHRPARQQWLPGLQPASSAD